LTNTDEDEANVRREETSAARKDVNLTSRLRLEINMSTQSDAGIEFGGRFRTQYDQNNGAPTARGMNGGRLHASMDPVRVEVGNVADAIDAMPGFYLPTTSVGTGVNGHSFPRGFGLVSLNPFPGYSSGGAGVANGVNLILSMGDLGLQVNANDGAQGIDNDKDSQVSAHVSYKIGHWQVALVYQHHCIDG